MIECDECKGEFDVLTRKEEKYVCERCFSKISINPSRTKQKKEFEKNVVTEKQNRLE
jgi:DNA-directed RNA polymerase subunit RPC12/RpoP